MALFALVAVVSGAVVSTAVAAQQDTTNTDNADVRIVARKLESGRIEFGLQQRQDDSSWGDRQLPRVRFFPTTATVGRWLASSPLDLPAGEVRIVARKLESGRIEFGLQQRQGDDSWGDRQLPRVRFFPTTAGINRWLASSPLALRTSPPANRDTTPPDSDATAPRPADRDTTPTSDDQYGQFEGDTVEVANPHSWWQRPRGDLVVHVHLCVEQGNEHLAKREVIDAHVRALNEVHAPFYAWQSSGLLNVSFTAGEITIANDVASHWGPGYLPGACAERLPPTRAHVGHAVILAGNPRTIGCAGWASLGGQLGLAFVTNAANLTVEDMKTRIADDNLGILRHELDHNIGNPHLNQPFRNVTNATRFRIESLEAWETNKGDPRWPDYLQQIVGTLEGFPAALQRQEEAFTIFPCYFLEWQGWPVGPNAPACGRTGPLPVQDLRVDGRLADGRPRVTWRPPPTGWDEQPVTGYTILLNGGDYIDARFDLPADARLFVLPPSPSGDYQVSDLFYFTVIPRSEIRLGSSERESAAVGFRLTKIRIREINPQFNAGCIEDCPPRSFELSWPANDLVESWGVVGTEGGGGVSRNSTTVTEGFEVIRGKTYNLTVLGCLKDPPPFSDRCLPYATATFTPRAPETRVTSGEVTWTYTGIETRQCPDCPAQDRRYQAEWTHIPGTTVYHVFAKACTDSSRPCHFEEALLETVEPGSSGTVTTHLFLLTGTRYEVDIHACGPEDDASQPFSCPVRLRSEWTVPPSGS